MSIEELIAKSDYKNVLKFFKEISDIPRGSGNNKGISDYLIDFAAYRKLKAIQDESLNVIIYKDASKGYEHLPAIIIQGHMDMVCVKSEDSSHDFVTEGLKLIADGDFIKADSTTLGADDGIALAYALALLDDDSLTHPALEILITTDEETGMYGAKAVDENGLSGKMMINIDSEDENVVLTSCAGGLMLHGKLPLRYSVMDGSLIRIKISGLKGGHSGIDINNNRANAVILMARLLMQLRSETEICLVSMKGGEKDNAIPVFCEADILAIDDDCDYIKEQIKKAADVYRHELSVSEPGLKVEADIAGIYSADVLIPSSFEKLLFVLIHAPNGVQVMSSDTNSIRLNGKDTEVPQLTSSDIPGLVESSLNLGVFYTGNQEAVFHYSIRSSLLSYKYFIRDKITHLLEIMGGSAETDSEYPAWEYRRDSELRDIFTKLYNKEYGRNPKFESIHAGLECGIISEKLPEADIISIGPKMYDIHTPSERLSISSAIRLYKFLEKLLEDIAKYKNKG